MISRAYDGLAAARGAGSWVAIADIRDALGSRIPRDKVDAALRRIEQRSNANIVPEANQKVLSDRDRAGAVWIGGQWKQFIAMNIPGH